MEKNKAIEIYQILGEMYPNACCELVYHNIFELVVATVLSAQTTDIAVNKVTPLLFSKYQTPRELAKANIYEVKEIIKTIGLSQTKTKNIIELSKKLVSDYDSIVPNDFDKLISLPGVGRKTANVVLAEGFNIPRIAVDTHVARVSNRLGLSESSDVLIIEKDLMNLYREDNWKNLHLRLLFFGRYYCKAINPSCPNCKFNDICKNKK